MDKYRNNIYLYHLLSFALGVFYFYGVIFFYNALGHYYGSYIASFINNDVHLLAILIINIITAFLGSMIPSIITMVILHFLLSPRTPVYLISVTLSYVLLSIYYSLSVPQEYINYQYVDYVVKYTGGLIFLYILSFVYLKQKPNKALKPDAGKAPRPLA